MYCRRAAGLWRKHVAVQTISTLQRHIENPRQPRFACAFSLNGDAATSAMLGGSGPFVGQHKRRTTTHPQLRGVHGGAVPSRHNVGPWSRWVAAGSSSCEIVLPETQPVRTMAAKMQAIRFIVAPCSYPDPGCTLHPTASCGNRSFRVLHGSERPTRRTTRPPGEPFAFSSDFST